MSTPTPGRVEVRLVRWLPADTARLRGRTAHPRRTRCEIATFLEASSDIVGGPYDVSLVEGSITTAADERRIKRNPRAVQGFGDDRRLRDRGRRPGAAKLRRHRRVHLRRLRQARVHRHAGDVHTRLRARQGRLPVAGLPDRPRPAARHARRAAGRPQAAAARQDGVYRMQTARA